MTELPTQYHEGVALFEQGKIEAAIEKFHDALMVEPSSHEIMDALGSALQAEGNVAEAIRHYTMAFSLSGSTSDQALLHLGIAYAVREELEQATKYFERALTINPSNAKVHTLMSTSDRSTLDASLLEAH